LHKKAYLNLFEAFKPFINKKVLKADNSLLKSVENILNPILKEFKTKYKATPYIQDNKKGSVVNTLYFDNDNNNIKICLRLCFCGGNHDNYRDKTNPYYCLYEERTLYLAQVKGDILININKEPIYKAINYKTELKKINKINQLEEEINKLKHNLQIPFNQYYEVLKWYKN